jgi:uncharacterized RDD family membrane protein YckC
MENTYEPQPVAENLLAEFEVNLERASTGKRFANLLIDGISFYVLVLVFAAAFPYAFQGIFATNDYPGEPIISRLLSSCLYGFYMSVVEAVFKGKTLGKLITGTRAVQEDGSPITPKMAFIRGFSRAVPFESFSAFGAPCYPWHDRWSHTYVIDEKASIMPA